MWLPLLYQVQTVFILLANSQGQGVKPLSLKHLLLLLHKLVQHQAAKVSITKAQMPIIELAFKKPAIYFFPVCFHKPTLLLFCFKSYFKNTEGRSHHKGKILYKFSNALWPLFL